MDVLSKLTNCKVFSTISQQDDEEAWLAARTRGLGGSDIGTICGVNKFSCARQLYLKKTGQDLHLDGGVDNGASERMHFGHVLEPVVADEYCRRTGNKIAVSPATLVHKDYPWALANIDRFIVDDEGNPVGILECKTAGEYMKNKWEMNEDDDEFTLPMSYIYQLNWYMWITGIHKGVLACLVGGNKFYYYDIELNEDIVKEMFEKGDKFWNYNVKQLVTPELDGSDAATELVKAENPDVVKNSEITITDEAINDMANTYVEAKEAIKHYEKVVDTIGNRIKDVMKNTEFAYTLDRTCRWAPRKQSRIDTAKLKSEYPDVYQAVLKESSYKVFTIK